MALATLYLGDMSRVRVSFTGAPAGADYALIERSTDGITWDPVRGGLTVPVTAGAGKVDDYDFVPGVLNTYRATYVDTGAPTAVAAGAVAVGNNTSVVPPLPAGIVTDDLLVILANIRNSGVGTVDTPAGWSLIAVAGNVAMLARRNAPGVVAPTVTFTGGVANATTMARMVGVRNAELSPVALANFLNPIQQDMPYPVIVTTVPNTFALYEFWKQDDWTSIAPAPTWSDTTTTGDDASMAIYGLTFPTTGTQPPGVVTVTGGATAISRVLIAAFKPKDFVSRETTTITPVTGSVWIKNPQRPSQNFAATVTDISDITRPSRVGVFEIVRRTLPVVVTDVQGSRRFALTITVDNLADAVAMDQKLATGNILLIQAPAANCVVPTMYAAITGDVRQYRNSKRTTRRYFEIPLTECAEPGNTTAGDTILWSDVIATYATWADVIAAKATWSDLIDSIGTGSVIVP